MQFVKKGSCKSAVSRDGQVAKQQQQQQQWRPGRASGSGDKGLGTWSEAARDFDAARMRQEAGIDASSSSLPARRPALLHPRPISATALAGGRCAARAACVQRLALAGWRAMSNGAAAVNRRIQSTGGQPGDAGGARRLSRTMLCVRVCVCVHVWSRVCEVYMVHGA